jgi:bacillithiol system protein YtxJ
MMEMKKIISVEEFNEVVNENESFLFLKHSTTCPISGAGHEAFSNYVNNQNSVKAYYLHVQEARPLSNYIAETYGVKHESPQALFFEDGKVKWDISHWKITEEELSKRVSK